MNLPNKLTVVRIFMIPLVIAAIMLGGVIPEYIAYLVAAALFGLASFTDMLDGKIARKHNLITDFGKFMDPLADKLMVIGTMLTIMYKFDAVRPYFFWAVLVVVFREFMVTGIRLIAVSAPLGKVIAANKLGKIKTVTQMICVLVALIEPAAQSLIARFAEDYAPSGAFPLTAITAVIMTVFTVWSGAAYLIEYRHFLKDC